MFFSRLASPFMKSVGVLLSGSALAQLLNVLGMPLLSRMYTPESIGALAIYTSMLGIAAIAATGRFDQALIQASDDEVNSLSWLVLVSAAIVFSLTVIWLLVFGQNTVKWLNAPSLTWLIYWLPFLLVIQSIYLLWIARMNYQRRDKKIATNRALQVVVMLMVSLGFGFFSNKTAGLVMGLSCGLAGSLFFLMRGSDGLTRPKLMELNAIVRKYINFPTFVLLSGLLDALAVLATPLWIGIRYGEEAAGYFSFTWRLLSIPMVLVGLAVSQVFYREASMLYQSNKRAARDLLVKTWRWMFLLGVIPFFVIYEFSDAIFPFVFGAGWTPSGQLAQILTPLAFMMFLNSPTSSIFLLGSGRKLLIAFCSFELIARLLAIFVLGDSLQISLEYMTWLEIAVIAVFNVLAIKRVF